MNLSSIESVARTVLAAATLLLGSVIALHAQSYPDRTITIVVPTAPGGVPDFMGRFVSKGLAKKYSANVIVENRPGAGSLAGANVVAKAKPDGYTMLAMPLGSLLSSITSRTIAIDFERDLVPVSVIADQPYALLANINLPVKDVRELISYAKEKPGELSFGTAGPGSLPDIAVQLLMTMTGTKMTGIPYGGTTQAMMDLLSDRIHLQFLPLGSALPHINSGKVRALGVSTNSREPGAPNIPPIGEALPGYSLPTWQALMITGGTPNDIIEQLNKDIDEMVSQPNAVASFTRLHLRLRPIASPAEDRAFILSEVVKWGKVLRSVGLAK